MSTHLADIAAELAADIEARLPEGVKYVLVLLDIESDEGALHYSVADDQVEDVLNGAGESIGEDLAFADVERQQAGGKVGADG
ncbi:MAG TPA: hypothetical protein VK524_09405 [Polyangiaceae bacterium]|nr:hypothetical protein [Polyangiaceae bacterium]